jgi:glycosyltransferase involved in cell wall biosynthesis
LLTYLASQIALFARLLTARGIDHDAVVYVNTLLPFGAALFGKVTQRKVIYHVHEVSIHPRALRWFLVTVARYTASKLIYVSDFTRSTLRVAGVPAIVAYNALPSSFVAQARRTPYRHRHNGTFSVLMLATLRDYKGVPEFLALAQRLSNTADIHFDLVANDDDATVQTYFSGVVVPANCSIHQRCDDPSSHYASASLVLSLSRVDACVETFGLTLLEAMAFGVPVIAPPVGGPSELVQDNVQGLLMDSRDLGGLVAAVSRLASDESLCLSMSAAARTRSDAFMMQAFSSALRGTVDGLQP